MGERDSGDEYIQKTVDADQDIGYEAAWPLFIPDGTIDLYTNLQLEELGKFIHINEQMDKVRDEMDKGEIGWFTKVDKEKGTARKEDLIFMMDMRLINAMFWTAEHMYEQFMKDPLMAEAVEGFLNGKFYDKQQAREFEINEFRAWWDQS